MFEFLSSLLVSSFFSYVQLIDKKKIVQPFWLLVLSCLLPNYLPTL